MSRYSMLPLRSMPTHWLTSLIMYNAAIDVAPQIMHKILKAPSGRFAPLQWGCTLRRGIERQTNNMYYDMQRH